MPTLGDVIRRQRELQHLSLREMARLSGVSNPYLSQIERGLRDPSEDIVEGIAAALDVTAQALFEAAGVTLGDEESEDPAGVEAAIQGDRGLKPAQRRALIETYRAFVIANGGPRPRPKPRSR
jgi:transcriptional regulator with XRE-family HTH domain